MATVERTAYPRFPKVFSLKESARVKVDVASFMQPNAGFPRLA